MDAWNYVNQKCDDGWKRGKKLDIYNDCNVKMVECPAYNWTVFDESDPTVTPKRYDNQTWALAEGDACVVTVDVKEADKPAFVVFDDTSYLGFEKDKYKVGKLITVREKTDPVLNITIYNAA